VNQTAHTVWGRAQLDPIRSELASSARLHNYGELDDSVHWVGWVFVVDGNVVHLRWGVCDNLRAHRRLSAQGQRPTKADGDCVYVHVPARVAFVSQARDESTDSTTIRICR